MTSLKKKHKQNSLPTIDCLKKGSQLDASKHWLSHPIAGKFHVLLITSNVLEYQFYWILHNKMWYIFCELIHQKQYRFETSLSKTMCII